MAKRTKKAATGSARKTVKKAAAKVAKKVAKATAKKTAAKKTASKKASAKKVSSKKAATKKATTKKATTKKAATKRAAAAVATLRIASIAPSADGMQWTVVTSDGAKRRLAAGAAQSAGVKAGGRWTDALARKVERAEREQKLFTKAMGILAKSGSTSYEVLVKKLGGDADARATVSALVEHGWIS
ncbi:MAG: Histone H1-like nucleoprotein [Planctomycetota bacterium]